MNAASHRCEVLLTAVCFWRTGERVAVINAIAREPRSTTGMTNCHSVALSVGRGKYREGGLHNGL
jgi:hypothetical protein